MALSTKLAVWGRDVEVFLMEGLSDDEQRKSLAAAARGNLQTAQQINRSILGRTPSHDTYVDGRKGASEDTVNPRGEILYEFQLVEDLLSWIGEMLVKHSPFKSGRYADSFVVYIDETIAEFNDPLPETWQEVVFVNLQPYARKIERGLSPQAPDGVFQVVAQMATRRFGNIAKIRFGYRAPQAGAIDAWAASTAMESPYRTGAKRDEWLRRQPAIIISR